MKFTPCVFMSVMLVLAYSCACQFMSCTLSHVAKMVIISIGMSKEYYTNTSMFHVFMWH